jgi:hypothetical protein
LTSSLLLAPLTGKEKQAQLKAQKKSHSTLLF